MLTKQLCISPLNKGCSPSNSLKLNNQITDKHQPLFLLLSLHPFSLCSHPSHSHSTINTKQSLHILRWREKTARKMTSVPKRGRRNGVKLRVGQKSRGEKVSRKEGGWEREREGGRARGKERKGGSRCFLFQTKQVNWVRCSIQGGGGKKCHRRTLEADFKYLHQHSIIDARLIDGFVPTEAAGTLVSLRLTRSLSVYSSLKRSEM